MRTTRTLRKHRVKRPRMVRREAKKAGLPLSYALAMLENETGIPQRNVFGCDWGSAQGPPYCHQKVTRARVKALRASGKANGVGWTQLTFPPFVAEADKLGGAHKPRYQMRVGFRILRDNIRRLGPWAGAKAYNGTGPAADAYANRWQDNVRKWEARLR
jgi:hypothetical protein